MSLSSVEKHLLAELTVDFTVLQIFLQVTDKIISKLCMEISNTFWVLSGIGAAYWSWLYLVTKGLPVVGNIVQFSRQN